MFMLLLSSNCMMARSVVSCLNCCIRNNWISMTFLDSCICVGIKPMDSVPCQQAALGIVDIVNSRTPLVGSMLFRL